MKGCRAAAAILVVVALAVSGCGEGENRGGGAGDRADIVAVVAEDAASPAFGEQKLPDECWNVRQATKVADVALVSVEDREGCSLKPALVWVVVRENGAWSTGFLGTEVPCHQDAAMPENVKTALRELTGDEACTK